MLGRAQLLVVREYDPATRVYDVLAGKELSDVYVCVAEGFDGQGTTRVEQLELITPGDLRPGRRRSGTLHRSRFTADGQAPAGGQ